MYKIGFTFLLLLALQSVFAQIPRHLPRGNSGVSSNDTSAKKDLGFEHRDDAKDSITVNFRFLDSLRNNQPDSSINDFYKYFSEPAAEQYLGNNGAAAYSLIFTPFMKPGWDAGFHAFDVYRFTLENTRFLRRQTIHPTWLPTCIWRRAAGEGASYTKPKT